MEKLWVNLIYFCVDLLQISLNNHIEGKHRQMLKVQIDETINASKVDN